STSWALRTGFRGSTSAVESSATPVALIWVSKVSTFTSALSSVSALECHHQALPQPPVHGLRSGWSSGRKGYVENEGTPLARNDWSAAREGRCTGGRVCPVSDPM